MNIIVSTTREKTFVVFCNIITLLFGNVEFISCKKYKPDLIQPYLNLIFRKHTITKNSREEFQLFKTPNIK